MTNLKQDLARYGELEKIGINLNHYGEEIVESFRSAMQLITVMQEALKHYTQVCSSVNDPNDFTPKIKDEGIYARNALSQAAKMGVE